MVKMKSIAFTLGLFVTVALSAPVSAHPARADDKLNYRDGAVTVIEVNGKPMKNRHWKFMCSSQ
jgi:hypothetical protein